MINQQEVKQWVYQVTSDVPLGIYSGMGNVVIVTPSRDQAMVKRDTPHTVSNGPQAYPATLTLELMERRT